MPFFNYKKLNENAVVPTYGTEFSAGADLYALIEDGNIQIAPNETYLVHTGIALEIPKGFGGFIFARSGLSTKKGLAPANKVGVIDSDYRGEIMVPLYNQSKSIQTVENGERIAQIVFLPFVKADFIETDELGDTKRSVGGFGSTGTK
ncbi:MAG: dUTP diphosphatase [Clostridia bacterium]|nr:dUTP diphosphatase [Clostridia bacterium]